VQGKRVLNFLTVCFGKGAVWLRASIIRYSQQAIRVAELDEREDEREEKQATR
jgi:hypothetical protein